MITPLEKLRRDEEVDDADVRSRNLVARYHAGEATKEELIAHRAKLVELLERLEKGLP